MDKRGKVKMAMKMSASALVRCHFWLPGNKFRNKQKFLLRTLTMVFTTVHTRSVEVTYRARKCSSAYFFSLACTIIKILFPLLLISKSVWIKTDTFNEQPMVKFKHSFMVVVEKIRPTTEPLFYSTFSHLNQAFDGNNIRIPIIRSYEMDTDRDGINENLHLEMSIPTKIDEEVIGVKLLLFFEYKLSNIRLEFESLLFIDCLSSFSSSQFSFYGEIKLDQKELLPPRGFREPLNSEILEQMDMETFSIMNVAKEYFKRNCE